jgi:hypothetical protein
MICNIIDRRTNSYNVCCDVCFEPSQHDNSIEGATKFTWGREEFGYDELKNTTIVLAIEYAQKYDCPVTMFLYDVSEVA